MSKVSQAGRPVYQQELAAIGWYFDHNRSRGVFVAEVDGGGYLGKVSTAEQAAETHAEGLNFPRAELSKLIHRAAMGTTIPERAPAFCRAGYSAFMGALGAMCDEQSATAISVLETTEGFIVGYSVPAPDGRSMERRRTFLDAAGIEELLTGSD